MSDLSRSRPSKSWAAAIVVLLAATLPAGPVFAQDPSADDPYGEEEVRRHGIFTDTVEVSLVEVEVRVLQGGEPVSDLAAGDFEVLVDGEPVEISHFECFGLCGAAAGEAEEAAGMEAAAESRVGEAAPAAPRGPAVPRPSTVVVLVDHRFVSAISREVTFRRLAGSLDELLAAGARIMVVSKERSLEVVQPPTAAAAEVSAALDRLAEVAVPDYASEVLRIAASVDSGHTAIEGRNLGRPSAVTPPATSEIDARAALQDARRLSQEIHADVRRSLRLLDALMGSLAGLPGRKVVIHVADRLPERPGEMALRVWYEKYGFDWGARLGVTSVAGALVEYDLSTEIAALEADASAAGVAFYPIGAGAAAGPNLTGAESRGVAARSRPVGRVTESDRELHRLAEATGGEAALGRGAGEGFVERLRRDLTHGYTLAFSSPHRGDGESHRLEVRVRRSGVEVRHPTAYRDQSAAQKMTDRTFAALMWGGGENPLEVRLEAGKARRQGGEHKVPLEVRIPLANLVLLPEKSAHRGEVTIQLVARDEAGRYSDPVTLRMPVEIPHAAILRALSESAVYRTELTVRPGRQRLAVGVHDEVGLVGSTVHLDLEVGG